MTLDEVRARHAPCEQRCIASGHCRCHQGRWAARPCDTAVTLAALAAAEAEAKALAEALKQAAGIAHRSQHDHNTSMAECRQGDYSGTGTRCGDWSAALTARRARLGGEG